jgi:hypothetical protein
LALLYGRRIAKESRYSFSPTETAIIKYDTKEQAIRLQKRVILKAAQIIGIEVPEEDLPEEWKGELFIVEKYLAGRGE